VHGVGIKLINLVIHDLTAGISAWSTAQNFEAYGNVVYNNGWLGTPHTHGHNVYTQNYISSQPKYFSDNIFLNCFQNNIQATAPLPRLPITASILTPASIVRSHWRSHRYEAPRQSAQQ
jgi:hypothetical protein